VDAWSTQAEIHTQSVDEALKGPTYFRLGLGIYLGFGNTSKGQTRDDVVSPYSPGGRFLMAILPTKLLNYWCNSTCTSPWPYNFSSAR
jgi:hypothetical protein